MRQRPQPNLTAAALLLLLAFVPFVTASAYSKDATTANYIYRDNSMIGSFAFGAGNFTVGLWFQTNHTAGGCVLGVTSTNTADTLQVWIYSASTVGVIWNTGTAISSTGNITFAATDGKWHYFAVFRVSANVLRFSVDSVAATVLDPTDSATTTSADVTTVALGIFPNTDGGSGTTTYTNPLPGLYDEVRVWTYSLTQAAIDQTATANVMGMANLGIYYTFETTGVFAADNALDNDEMPGPADRWLTMGDASAAISSSNYLSCTALPTAVSHASVSCSSAVPVNNGTVCNYICDPGYLSAGSAATTCLATATAFSWTAASLSCSLRPCTTPPAELASATVLNISCSVPSANGTVCALQCNSAIAVYSSGGFSHSCFNGTWISAGPLVCGLKPCPTSPPLSYDVTAGNCTAAPPFAVGTVCAPTCVSTATLSGALTTSCQLGGSWTASAGFCLSKCTQPYSASAYTSCSTPVTSGSPCSLSCATGYSQFGGTPTVPCNNGTYGSLTGGTCVKQCDAFSQVGYSGCTGYTNSGSSCTLLCDTGYSSAGATTVPCSAGTWGAISNPCIQQCSAFSQAGYSGCTGYTNSSSSCTLSCATGYFSSGTPSVSCSTGSWGSITNPCIQQCSAFSQAGYNGCTGYTNSGSSCTLTCGIGFSSSGTPSVSCTTGSWGSITNPCVAQCSAFSQTGYTGCNGYSNSGSSCPLICATGYASSGTPSVSCSTGTWGAITNPCVLQCSGFAQTGYTGCTGYTNSGSSCSLSCAGNYSMTGSPSVSCSNGVWGSITNGDCGMECLTDFSATGYNNCASPAADSSTCQLTCASGYSIFGSPSVTCSSGSWSAISGGDCLAQCAAYSPPTGYTASNCSGVTDSQTECYLGCANGYSTVGTPTTLCSAGSWQAIAGAACDPNCGAYTAGTGYMQSCGASTANGQSCDLSCATGYHSTSGSPYVTCSASSWSAVSGGDCRQNCVAYSVPTGYEATAAAGPCTGSSIYSGGSCELACATGYMLNGTVAPYIDCADGFWSEMLGSNCLKQCGGYPATSPYTAVGTTCDTGSYTDPFQPCVLDCRSGYNNTVNGLIEVVCGLGGVWSANIVGTGQCDPLPCTTAPAAAKSTGFAAGNCAASAESGSSCTLACASGYVVEGGSLSVTCTAAAWSAPAGHCKASKHGGSSGSKGSGGSGKSGGSNSGAVAGGVVAAIVGVALIAGLVWWRRRHVAEQKSTETWKPSFLTRKSFDGMRASRLSTKRNDIELSFTPTTAPDGSIDHSNF